MQGKINTRQGIPPMLRLIGIIFLVGGSIGMGWSMRDRLKKNLDTLYQIRQIFKMLQNEIIYSRASLPEACRHISEKVNQPYSSAFLAIHEEMNVNSGESFTLIWKKHMNKCIKEISVSAEDKNILLEFGNSIGYLDGTMQAQAIEQYMHRLDVSVSKMEKEMTDKCKVIMSLSVMGGLMIAIILI